MLATRMRLAAARERGVRVPVSAGIINVLGQQSSVLLDIAIPANAGLIQVAGQQASIDAGASGTLVNQSTFTAANGTTIQAYTPDVGGMWTVHSGGFTITDGTVRPISSAPYATVNSGASIVRIKMDVLFPGTTFEATILTQFQDNSNHWECRFNIDHQVLRIVEYASGVTIRREVAATINSNQLYTIEVEIHDSQYIRFTGAGVEVSTDASGGTPFPIQTFSNNHGITSTNFLGADAHIDNFEVYEL